MEKNKPLKGPNEVIIWDTHKLKMTSEVLGKCTEEMSIPDTLCVLYWYKTIHIYERFRVLTKRLFSLLSGAASARLKRSY